MIFLTENIESDYVKELEDFMGYPMIEVKAHIPQFLYDQLRKVNDAAVKDCIETGDDYPTFEQLLGLLILDGWIVKGQRGK